MNKKNKFNSHSEINLDSMSEIIKTLTSFMRIDIKNFGTENNSTLITADNAKIATPTWFSDDTGQGKVFSSSSMKSSFKIKVINDGKLSLSFKGIDKRHNNIRLPAWCDYKSIKINGKELLTMPVATWHDKSFKHEIFVKNGEEFEIEIEQQFHQYIKEKLKELLLKLDSTPLLVKKNIDKIINSNLLSKFILPIDYEILSDYPNLDADAFISLGHACRAAYWLKKYSLRTCSLPFDWMMGYTLQTILKTFINGVTDWFIQYYEDYERIGRTNRYVVDTLNNIISMHAFPTNKSVKEYMPEFKATFIRRYERMKNLFLTKKKIVFICYRNDDISEFYFFLHTLNELYPHCNFSLINITHSNNENIIKYSTNNINIYQIYSYDINENGGERKNNPDFWIGNTKLWKNICSKMSFNTNKEIYTNGEYMNKNNIITVKNAEDDPDTQAEIIIQNKIDYTPKVSVIIPVYNVEEYLRECLDSVVNQTLKEIEIICVDDGSTDNSLEILKEYAQKDNRITVIKQENLHAGVARNAGLAVAKGEYVHFLDSDDWVDKNIYNSIYKIGKNNQIDLIKFKSYAYNTQSKEIFYWSYTSFEKFPKNLFDKVITFCDNYKPLIDILDVPWNALYQKKFLINSNIKFDNLICANDTSFFYKCLINARKIYISSEQHLYYRMNNPKSLIGIRIKNFDCQLKQYHIIDNIIANQNSDFIKLVRTKLISSIIERFRSYLTNDSYDYSLKKKLQQQTQAFFDTLPYEIFPNSNLEFFYEHIKPIKSKSKVAIIIPVYNVEKYLREGLNSIVNQTLKDIEIICIDDGSTDSSLEILKEYANNDKRIKIFEQSNSFAGAARNKGIKLSNSEYIAFFDPDDWVDLDMYEKMYAQAKTLNSDIVFSDFERYDQNSKKSQQVPFFTKIKHGLHTVKNEIEPLKNIDKEKIRESLLVFPCYSWNKIYSSDFIRKYDIKFETYQCYEDWLFVISSHLKASNISYINRYFYKYRYHNTSTLRKTKDNRYLYIYTILKQIKEYLHNENVSKQILNNFNYFAAINLYWVYADCNSDLRESNDMKEAISNGKTLLSNEYILYLNEKLATQKKCLQLIELNECHGECMPGYIKYFHDLGYKVNILLNEKQKSENPLYMFKDCVDITYLPENKLIQYINSNQLDNYDVCLFNSNIIYSQKSCSIFDLITTQHKKVKMLCVEHRLENIPTLIKSAIPIVLKKFDKNEDVFEVNTHYFGSFKDHNKNEITNFIIVGNIEGKRKNYNLLTSTVRRLHETNIKNFKITIVGKGNISDIPLEIQHYFDIKGRLSYPDMYHEMENADYFLTLLDPENPEHDRYLKLGTSGSFQLIYGFSMPCLIAEKFAEIHLLNQNNSIIYKTNNELYNSMLLAINQSNDDYSKIKKQIKETASILYKKSLTNLEKAIEKASYLYKNQINNSPLLFKDIGFGCKTWCEPKNVTGNDIKSYTYDLSDNIYTRYVSWDPIKEGTCDIEIIRLSAVEKRSKRVVEFPINKIVSSGKISGNKVEFRNQKGCWIGCTVEGAYESFTIEAKIKNI